MQIVVNGKIATLKQGASFEFVSENRSFTDSDGYSFSMSFPLADCPDNIDIFGHLNRTDVDKTQIIFDCEIIDTYFYRVGVLTITEISQTEIKAQFLEGRSAQNYDNTFDDIYINELDLGEPESLTPPKEPNTAWQGLGHGQEYVALPWVNNSSGNIQNEVVYSDGAYQWSEDVSGLSFFPYLIAITKRICSAVGYKCDLSEWNADEAKRYILICNALPYAWDIPQFARALPHWTVTEFFEKLEQFIGGEFDIDHKAKSISFAFTKTVISSADSVIIDNVLDSFTSEVTTEDESNYIENATIKYKECDHLMQKFYACRWFIKENIDDVISYDTLEELISANKKYRYPQAFSRKSSLNKVLYAKDFDTYFVVRVVQNVLINQTELSTIYQPVCVLQPINVFGEKVVDENSDNEIELDFVPAWIDETEDSKGNCLFLEMAGYDENITSEKYDPFSDPEFQTLATQRLNNGELEERTEYFDTINVAFWNGTNYNIGYLPCPILDSLTVRKDWSYFVTPFSMRLASSSFTPIFNIEPKQKYTFSFLMDEMPNVRSVFFINGKKYLCEKITATFSESGMSQLKKGTFYRIME